MKLTKRKGFNFFRSYYDVYNELENDSDKVAFIEALLDRQFLGKKPTDLKGMAKFAYISQTNSIDSQVKGYETKTGRVLSTPTEPPTAPPTVGVENIDLTPLPTSTSISIRESKRERESKKVYSEEVNECFLNCLKYFEPQLHPKTEKIKNNWFDTIDKLNRIDKIPFELIEKITMQTRQDEFWRDNFMSLTKLRQKQKSSQLPYILVFNEKFNNNGKSNNFTEAKSINDKIDKMFS